MSPNFSALTICLVGPHYPRVGGISTQVELLTHYLWEEGAEVQGVDTNVQAARGLGALSRLLSPLAQVLIVPLRLWRAARDADLIHAHLAAHWGFYLPLVTTLLVGKGRRLPIVVTCHSGLAADFVPRHRRLVRALLRRVDAIITLSPWTASLYRELGLNPVCIPNVVDLTQFSPGVVKSGGAAENDGPRLLWVKYFTPVGQPDQMVRSFGRIHQALPGATLTMVGWGELLDTTRSLAQDLELPIEFTGFVPFGAVNAYYRQADIFVYNSEIDNQPNALLEASACGLPIVATAVGGIPDMVEDGVNALLVPPHDEEAFAGAVFHLARNPELAQRLGEAAQANAQRFTWPAVRDRLGALYQQLAARSDGDAT